MQQKIVLIGGPGTGKTSVINNLSHKGFFCMEEVSREVTLKAKEEGIDQLFLTEPLLFSKKLLAGREQQYLTANRSDKDVVFFDRGIPDVQAYLAYFKSEIPTNFIEKSNKYRYTTILHFPPWKAIYTTDNERYEQFEQSLEIDTHILKTYADLKYPIYAIPFGTIEERTDYILHLLSL